MGNIVWIWVGDLVAVLAIVKFRLDEKWTTQYGEKKALIMIIGLLVIGTLIGLGLANLSESKELEEL